MGLLMPRIMRLNRTYLRLGDPIFLQTASLSFPDRRRTSSFCGWALLMVSLVFEQGCVRRASVRGCGPMDKLAGSLRTLWSF